MKKLAKGLIVFCQVYPSDPMYTPDMALQFAKAAVWGGASGIRANSPEQISMIKKKFPELPVIGIWKKWKESQDVYITPSLEDAKAVLQSGADIIACDGTCNLREDGQPAWKTIEEIHKWNPDALVFADIADFQDARAALKAGADIIAPTLRGYTPNTQDIQGPDFAFLQELAKEKGEAFLIMEGHIARADQAKAALEYGADAVVVGSAITRPHFVTQWFVQAMEETK